MQTKRIIELCFLALFALGVGISLVIHQTYDQWLSQLVQASGTRVAGGPLKISQLQWQSAEQTLSLSGGEWFDDERASTPWLKLSAARWQLKPGAWQGAEFSTEHFELSGLEVFIRQEGLSTNINRLIKQVESAAIKPETVGRGKEPLVFKVDQVVLKDLALELTTTKHGVLRWNVPQLILTPGTEHLPFDVLLQQVTRALLNELKTQTTQQLLTLTEGERAPVDAPSADH
jgi:hypothetical protein